MAIDIIEIFRNESSRVKSCSFHPTRTWILVSLHTGTIQLWDYRMGFMISTYSEHEGPVRSISFHPHKSIFVSGGDDTKVKVWSSQGTSGRRTGNPEDQNPGQKSMFTLHGHLDYVRSVSFHHENPWILSCSDDQTLRIWNWISRECISICTGHNHYVMHASFSLAFPDLIASASLDQTIRIWDVSGLRRKRTLYNSSGSNLQKNLTPNSGYLQLDLLSTSDIVTKHILEGHERGVNFVCWHPNGRYLISGSDDKQIKVWQIEGSRCWETYNLSGHYGNVSSCIYGYGGSVIVSNSEDKMIKIWDTSKKTCLLSSNDMREGTNKQYLNFKERFWSLECHQKRNLFAAAHDSGFVVFKLEKQRLPHYCLDVVTEHGRTNQHALFYQNYQIKTIRLDFQPKDNEDGRSAIDCCHAKENKIISVGTVQKSMSNTVAMLIGMNNIEIKYNQYDKSVMIIDRRHLVKKGHKSFSIEVYSGLGDVMSSRVGGSDKSHSNHGSLTNSYDTLSPDFKTSGYDALFVGKHKICVLGTDTNSLMIYNVNEKEAIRTYQLGFKPCFIFDYNSNLIILLSSNDTEEEKTISNLESKFTLYIYDINLASVIKEVSVPVSLERHSLKGMKWSDDRKMIAMYTKYKIIVYNRNFDEVIFYYQNDIPIKSIFWTVFSIRDENTEELLKYSVLLFSTHYYIGYLIPGCKDVGTLVQIDEPMYIIGTNVKSDSDKFRESLGAQGLVYGFGRKPDVVVKRVKFVEVLFKLCSYNLGVHSSYMEMIINSNQLTGKASLNILRLKGNSDIALYLSKEIEINVQLALECQRYELAFELCNEFYSGSFKELNVDKKIDFCVLISFLKTLEFISDESRMIGKFSLVVKINSYSIFIIQDIVGLYFDKIKDISLVGRELVEFNTLIDILYRNYKCMFNILLLSGSFTELEDLFDVLCRFLESFLLPADLIESTTLPFMKFLLLFVSVNSFTVANSRIMSTSKFICDFLTESLKKYHLRQGDIGVEEILKYWSFINGMTRYQDSLEDWPLLEDTTCFNRKNVLKEKVVDSDDTKHGTVENVLFDVQDDMDENEDKENDWDIDENEMLMSSEDGKEGSDVNSESGKDVSGLEDRDLEMDFTKKESNRFTKHLEKILMMYCQENLSKYSKETHEVLQDNLIDRSTIIFMSSFIGRFDISMIVLKSLKVHFLERMKDLLLGVYVSSNLYMENQITMDVPRFLVFENGVEENDAYKVCKEVEDKNVSANRNMLLVWMVRGFELLSSRKFSQCINELKNVLIRSCLFESIDPVCSVLKDVSRIFFVSLLSEAKIRGVKIQESSSTEDKRMFFKHLIAFSNVSSIMRNKSTYMKNLMEENFCLLVKDAEDKDVDALKKVRDMLLSSILFILKFCMLNAFKNGFYQLSLYFGNEGLGCFDYRCDSSEKSKIEHAMSNSRKKIDKICSFSDVFVLTNYLRYDSSFSVIYGVDKNEGFNVKSIDRSYYICASTLDIIYSRSSSDRKNESSVLYREDDIVRCCFCGSAYCCTENGSECCVCSLTLLPPKHPQ